MNTMPDSIIPESVSFRLVQEDDAALLARLQAEMDDDLPLAEHQLDIAAMRQTLKIMATYPDFHAYFLLDHDQIIGSFSLLIFASPSHQGSPQALLDAVVITAARRSEGYGEMMIQQAMQLAASAGCYKMMLSSNLKRVAAHRFYERLGFVQHGLSFSIEL
ncbi:GNAT family N-acetyltransferase [Undibacterium sp. SXout7W]|uniref:GNAT family N-acetyltransferase n=1 Tax=Undibacterium sp. SXout7W TaxID=3413049 RepID=UPI003BF1472C